VQNDSPQSTLDKAIVVSPAERLKPVNSTLRLPLRLRSGLRLIQGKLSFAQTGSKQKLHQANLYQITHISVKRKFRNQDITNQHKSNPAILEVPTLFQLSLLRALLWQRYRGRLRGLADDRYDECGISPRPVLRPPPEMMFQAHKMAP